MSSTINEIYSDKFKIRMFIKNCTGPIPDELKFEGWQTSGKYNKPIHDWIEHRKGEPIPDEMKFDGW